MCYLFLYCFEYDVYVTNIYLNMRLHNKIIFIVPKPHIVWKPTYKKYMLQYHIMI